MAIELFYINKIDLIRQLLHILSQCWNRKSMLWSPIFQSKQFFVDAGPDLEKTCKIILNLLPD